MIQKSVTTTVFARQVYYKLCWNLSKKTSLKRKRTSEEVSPVSKGKAMTSPL